MEFPEQSEDYDGEEVSCMMNQFGSEVCLMNSGIEQSVEVIPEKKDNASINFVALYLYKKKRNRLNKT